MSDLTDIHAEHSGSKVAGIFPSETAARDAAAAIRQSLGLTDAQVQVVTAADPAPGRKLEPEGRGIFRTLIVAHVKLGIVGAVVGAVFFAALWALGFELFVAHPVIVALASIGLGALAGLLLGGLVTLRPDHDAYIHGVLDALEQGKAAVVVHAFSGEERSRAEDALKRHGADTFRTL